MFGCIIMKMISWSWWERPWILTCHRRWRLLRRRRRRRHRRPDRAGGGTWPSSIFCIMFWVWTRVVLFLNCSEVINWWNFPKWGTNGGKFTICYAAHPSWAVMSAGSLRPSAPVFVEWCGLEEIKVRFTFQVSGWITVENEIIEYLDLGDELIVASMLGRISV